MLAGVIDMFWRKCGKLLLKDGNTLSDCPECPCGYYGLFVIDYRNKSYKEGDNVDWEINDYCYKNLNVFAYNVINNSIDVSQYMYAYDNICVPISRTPDSSGKVGSLETSIISPYDCAEYNDDYTECLKHYINKYQIDIYRIGACYDDYNEFASWFYGGCGVSPDADGKYPAIFEQSYGQTVMTSNASNCIYNHWQSVADEKYRPQIKLTFDTYQWGYNMWPFSQKCETREICYSYCDGSDCAEYGDDGCIRCEDGGTLKKDCHDECDHTLYDAIMVNATVEGQEYWYSIGGYAYWKDDCYMGQGCWMYEAPDCCEYWSGSRRALQKVNEYDEQGTSNLDGYSLENTDAIDFPRQYGNLCWGKEYEAYHGCYGDKCYQFWRSVRYGKMTIDRGANTPAGVMGVECLVTAYTYKTNDEDSIVKDQYDYIWENEKVIFMFGEEMQFPLVNNCKQYYISSEQECNDDCEYGFTPDYAPEGWHNQTEVFRIDLAVLRYV